MADIADISDERQEVLIASSVQDIHRAAADIPVGVPGDCETCGEWAGRLVDGMCAPCRDKFAKMARISGRA